MKQQKQLPIAESRAELIESQNLSSDKRFPNDLVCFAVFLSAKLTCDDSVIQLPKTFTRTAPWHIFNELPHNEHWAVFGCDL